MKKLLKILPVVLLIAACGSNDEIIKKKIIQKKTQITKIEKQIADLEKQLADTNDTKKLVPVSVKEMQYEPFNHFIIVYGNVEAENYGMISPEMNGRIRKIHVKAGHYAKKGDLLVSLNTDAVEQQIISARANKDLAVSTYEKQKALWDQEIGSEIQYLQAKSAKEAAEAQLEALEAQLRMSQIRAPYDGYVDKVFPKEGELASPGVPVLEFVNLSSLLIKADVSESYIGIIKEGQKVELSFTSLPDYNKMFPIKRIAKVINRDSRTFEIELAVPNSNKEIKPNMVSTIKINDFATEKAFVIPSLVIRSDISGDYVYLVEEKEGESMVAKRYIEKSMSYNDQTMVVSGLNENDRVIVEGYNLVSTGIPVNVK